MRSARSFCLYLFSWVCTKSMFHVHIYKQSSLSSEKKLLRSKLLGIFPVSFYMYFIGVNMCT